MKPVYIFSILWAAFITLLAGGISMALVAIPGVGIILALVVSYCINITMGCGLLYFLISEGMYHPKVSPFVLIGGLIPGLDFLPFWIGLVIAGIVQKMSEEKGLLGNVARVAVAAQSMQNPSSALRGAQSLVKNTERAITGRPPQAANDNQMPEGAQETPRSLGNLKSPNTALNMSSDITRPSAGANDNQLHAKAA